MAETNFDAVAGSLNNKFVQLLAPTAYSNNNDAQLSESIENYDELYIELYINTSNGFRIASSLIPVSVIKNNGYGTSNQYIVNAVGTANITSDKIAYVIFAQIAFKNAQTINMESSGYNGWSGTLYVSIYAK